MHKNYKTGINRSAFIATFGGLLILIVSIGAPLIFAPKDNFVWKWPMIFPVAIFGFFIFVIGASLLKFFIRFTISPRGLSIRKPFFHNRHISKHQIKKVTLISVEQSRQLMDQDIRSQYGFKENADISGYFQMIKRKSPYYKYLTVTPMAKTQTAGEVEHLKKLSVKMDEKIVLLEYNDNGKLYLSPKNTEDFYQSLKKIME